MSVILNNQILQALAPVAAGSSAQTTAIIDMQGYEKVVFIVSIGTLTTGQTLGVLQVNGGQASNGSDMAALVGATITVADADASKVELLEVVKPTNCRYVELVFTRNSQAAQIVEILAVLFANHKQPISALGTNVAQAVCAVDPEVSTSGVTTTSGTYGGVVTVVSTYRSSS